jgi:hypothetical protein
MMRENGRDEFTTVDDVSDTEHYVTVQNNIPGLNRIIILVNDTPYRLHGLQDGQVINLDIASAMKPGNHNRIVIMGRGRPSGTAQVTIADIPF